MLCPFPSGLVLLCMSNFFDSSHCIVVRLVLSAVEDIRTVGFVTQRRSVVFTFWKWNSLTRMVYIVEELAKDLRCPGVLPMSFLSLIDVWFTINCLVECLSCFLARWSVRRTVLLFILSS
ncbi:uncharacterized protein SPPG_09307 [Spizellomyces punctatus DAOM BR117]|uniref:Uncharacterized protein n=1 Tax=Spizellomyces punctatus (strain DAOM BR117) TaxID=645134 RepID=A0A0L0HB50_SPIPD|nr:uncharacterized protein SPPG_09307 [Spizellomyces punctatus DAOM BR117]KNC98810.1 hypothetical protein SPPG_09307 [Spizellomyces punctatus DAOM BR117]|eukprot:XP_016606850.1 hypothetical protein SPPG_09307 [Spizellomyces punctatus DAOM BR117]